jgi:hypothetical protein
MEDDSFVVDSFDIFLRNRARVLVASPVSNSVCNASTMLDSASTCAVPWRTSVTIPTSVPSASMTRPFVVFGQGNHHVG